MKPETRSFYELAVQRAVEEVVANLDRALDLQALARGAALSPFHFHRIFRGMLGETPLELHRRLRMERAAWCLLHEETAVTTLAFAAGYETHESFTRAFREHYACSPSEFRQSRQVEGVKCVRPGQIELATRSSVHFRPKGSFTLELRFLQGQQTMDVRIQDMRALRVATLTHVGPYNRISEAFARLGEVAGKANLFGPHTQMIGIYHDDPETTPANELRSEAGIVIAPDAKIPPALGERQVAAGRYATTIHVGPYEELGDVWTRLMGKWLVQSGQRMKQAVSYEIYRNTPMDVPKEKLITELYLPIE